ncbi:MAG TPA: sigma-54 dependent transcriptional regulator [candidate division Zixibacteria bacterium]|nr:sigma-54 dependent transcriptional regulator [candidate division Zixibacteria bacterium]
MPNQTAVYGDVLNRKQQRLIRSKVGSNGRLVWYDRPELYSAEDRIKTIFVDLDSPNFARDDFLVSLATGGKEVKLIGKSDQPTQEKARRVAKLGVSEVLTSDQCLRRLDWLLNELEEEGAGSGEKPSRYGLDAIIGESPAISEIRSAISTLSDVDFPSALILGPTGSGKGLVAKVLHHTGMRRKHNLVEVNCSAIPDDLFESELFGHVKGAFTDAKHDKMGLFEYAAGGTIFLDEVGNLTASAQAKLLKVLEDKKLRRVGDVNHIDIDVRVLAATNIDLEEAMHEGRFREDLYFRLSLLTLQLPPLADRPEDIRRTALHYLDFYSTIYRKNDLQLSDKAISEMMAYSWPGNVRELCNVIERAVLLTQTRTISLKDIKGSLKKGRVSLAERQQIVIDVPPQGFSLEEAEQSIVLQVLDMFKWNKTLTAKFLGISRPRLRRIIEAGGFEQDRRKT